MHPSAHRLQSSRGLSRGTFVLLIIYYTGTTIECVRACTLLVHSRDSIPDRQSGVLLQCCQSRAGSPEVRARLRRGTCTRPISQQRLDRNLVSVCTDTIRIPTPRHRVICDCLYFDHISPVPARARNHKIGQYLLCFGVRLVPLTRCPRASSPCRRRSAKTRL
jgi:hypothetical protein